MDISPLHSCQPPGKGIDSPGPAESATGTPFAKVVDQMLNETRSQQTNADLAVRDLVTGKTDNIHNVMLAVAQADLTFRMIVELRNRLTEAYQEVMRMQV